MENVLHDAEARARAAATARHAEEAAIVESVRAEIRNDPVWGDLYAAAMTKLPMLEKAIAKEYQPFLQQIAAIAQASGRSLDLFRDLLESIAKCCESGPRQLREGIAAFEALSFDQMKWKDGRQVDINQRAFLISEIRRKLRSFDGVLSFMASQKARVEHVIRESDWPQRSGPPAATVTITEPPRRDAGIEVEIGGRPEPPL